MIIRGNEVPVDVQAELEAFEWEKEKWTEEQLIACSPFRPDNSPSFYCWLVETDKAPAGAWGDRGAEGEFEKGSFISLLSFLRDETEEEVIEYLESKYGVSGEDGKFHFRKIRLRTDKGARQTLDMGLLENLGYHPYLEGRGIPKGVQKALKVGYVPEKKAIAIPWFLPDGRLASIKYRRVDSKRFFYEKGGFPVARLLYGIQVLHEKEYLDTVVITEAEIDAMSAMAVGFPAVAVGGASFNEYHASLLKQTNVKRVIIASDNDAAGSKLRQQIKDLLGSYFGLATINYPDDVKDLNDMNWEQRKGLLKNALPINGFKLM